MSANTLFLLLTAAILPVVNVTGWWIVDSTGGSHGHPWRVIALAATCELVLIAVAAAKLRPSPIRMAAGLLVDVAATIGLLYATIAVFLVISCWGGCD